LFIYVLFYSLFFILIYSLCIDYQISGSSLQHKTGKVQQKYKSARTLFLLQHNSFTVKSHPIFTK